MNGLCQNRIISKINPCMGCLSFVQKLVIQVVTGASINVLFTMSQYSPPIMLITKKNSNFEGIITDFMF